MHVSPQAQPVLHILQHTRVVGAGAGAGVGMAVGSAAGGLVGAIVAGFAVGLMVGTLVGNLVAEGLAVTALVAALVADALAFRAAVTVIWAVAAIVGVRDADGVTVGKGVSVSVCVGPVVAVGCPASWVRLEDSNSAVKLGSAVGMAVTAAVGLPFVGVGVRVGAASEAEQAQTRPASKANETARMVTPLISC